MLQRWQESSQGNLVATNAIAVKMGGNRMEQTPQTRYVKFIAVFACPH
ncbi:MAG: hypothetical protein KME42_22595 [Tildeniella nuda ZEHNDER 1965/U140]|nr:hypothetical protein [Tildeniella nuda ZEHNDER 1965/U140]